MVVTWMALQLGKSAVASYMRIKWDTAELPSADELRGLRGYRYQFFTHNYG